MRCSTRCFAFGIQYCPSLPWHLVRSHGKDNIGHYGWLNSIKSESLSTRMLISEGSRFAVPWQTNCFESLGASHFKVFAHFKGLYCIVSNSWKMAGDNFSRPAVPVWCAIPSPGLNSLNHGPGAFQCQKPTVASCSEIRFVFEYWRLDCVRIRTIWIGLTLPLLHKLLAAL